MIPNPQCNCCSCLLFQDDFTGDSLGSDWDVISGSMTLDADADTAEIAAGSVVGPATDLPGGSGGLEINITQQLDSLTIRFAYADANNHWRVDISASTVDYGVGPVNALLYEFYETIGGVSEYIGGRKIDSFMLGGWTTRICWYEGGRVSFFGPDGFPSPLIAMTWPNHVVGGNSFRLEPGYDLTVNYADWAQHILDHPGLSVPPCNCTTQECMWCDGEWGDTMLITFLDGPHTGQAVTVSRHRTFFSAPEYPSGGSQMPLSYWYFSYYSDDTDPDGFDWDVVLSFCITAFGAEEPHDQGSISVQNSLPGGTDPQGISDFTMAGCSGPWDVIVDGVTIRITPSDP